MARDPKNFSGYTHQQMKNLLEAGDRHEERKRGNKVVLQFLGVGVLAVAVVGCIAVGIFQIIFR